MADALRTLRDLLEAVNVAVKAAETAAEDDDLSVTAAAAEVDVGEQVDALWEQLQQAADSTQELIEDIAGQ